MAIVAECPACGKRFKAGKSLVGKKAKCSQCGLMFVIGAGASTSAPSSPGAPGSQPEPVTGAASRAPGDLPPVASRNGGKPSHASGRAHAAARRIAPAKPQPPAPEAHRAAPVAKSTPAAASAAAPVKPAARLAGEVPATGTPAPVREPARLEKPVRIESHVDADAPRPGPPAPAPTPPASAERMEELSADRPAAHRRSSAAPKLFVAAAMLLIVAGAAYFILPRLLNRPHDKGHGSVGTVPNGPVTLVMAGNLDNASPAWQAAPDAGGSALHLAQDFRLVIPCEESLRYAAGQIVLAAAPSPFAAIPAWPDGDRTGPETISIWDLSKQSRLARFKPSQRLAWPVLSPDGAYYAGQVADESSRAVRVEVWSTVKSQLVYSLTIPDSSHSNFPLAVGFPGAEQVMILGDRLRVVDLPSKTITLELGLPSWSDETRIAVSRRQKLIAIADSRALHLIDTSQRKVLGPMSISDSIIAHPRKRLALRALDFSPDGAELALVFDNRLWTRRIAVVDVASGRLKTLHMPAAPVYTGGPDLQWTDDGRGWLVSNGTLIDRDTARQIGQVYTDLPDEGLGGALVSLLAESRALVAWDKHPRSIVLRAVPCRCEKPDWVNVQIASAAASLYETLECHGHDFGNFLQQKVILQRGRMMDGAKFLAVEIKFTASLSDKAPDLVPLRPDQFTLLADGLPRSPIGTLGEAGVLSLEQPEYDIRRRESLSRTRTVVFATTGEEKSLILQVGSAQRVLELPRKAELPMRELALPPADRVNPNVYNAPDDSSAVAARIVAARLGPHVESDLGDQAPLSVTYSSPDAWLLTVKFEITAKSARSGSRGVRSDPPQFGLLLQGGTLLRPIVELPEPLPAMMSPGERYAHTCLFVLRTDPAKASAFRLTCDGLPVATIPSESLGAR